jgi:DNA-binding NarL/FixJ family response regulator
VEYRGQYGLWLVDLKSPGRSASLSRDRSCCAPIHARFVVVGADASEETAFAELTQRERQVLELIARGLDNTAIVSNLSVSPKAVRNHINGIFDKLNIPNRAQAIVRARDAGMGIRTG